MKTLSEQGVLDKVHEGFRRVGLTFPYLVGLIAKVQPQLDTRVPALGIFASGRLVVNPDFVRSLSPQDLMFVLAHELYHLTLRTHERAEGTDPRQFNFAHDYIINDMLREELGVKRIPAGGLDWHGARFLSAEKIMADLAEQDSERGPQACWNTGPGRKNSLDRPNPGDDEQEEAEGQGGDVLGRALEREMFPDQPGSEQQGRAKEVREQAARAMTMQALMESMKGKGRGDEAGTQEDTMAALRGFYRPPWELALQRWLESAAPSDRTYSRPSRRGADRTDVVLPGRKRESWTLHIVLDTSGSMVDEVPRALGVIADFCEALGVEEVHLIQCDTAIGTDEVLAPAEMANWRVSGFGGSDLTPAMLRLAENPEVGAAIVLTDGDIEYPETGVAYNVLWVLPAWKNLSEFAPRYGKVISMTNA